MRFKTLFIAALLPIFAGCALLKQAGERYSEDRHTYQAAFNACVDNDKHTYKGIDSGGQPVELQFAAGNCDQISDPVHGGQFVSDIARSALNAGGVVLGAAIQADATRSAARTRANASVETAQINADVDIARTETLEALIESNSTLTQQVIGTTEVPSEAAPVEAEVVDGTQ